MERKRRRTLDGLGDPDYAELAFQAIELAFNPAWLEVKGDHPIKKLWDRHDRLATVELFIFGAAIEKLSRTQPEWLKRTIQRVKTDKPYIGFITEIIACAQLEILNGKLVPAQKSQKGYDLVAMYENGFSHFISVKNHDESVPQKDFNQYCKQLRNLWRMKLALEKRNLALRIFSTKQLLPNDFELIKAYLQKDIDLENRESVTIGDSVGIVVSPLPLDGGNLSRSYTSDMFMVVSPAPDSEQFRFERNVAAAAKNMRKNIVLDERSCNVVFMRVHVNADLISLTETAQKLLNDGTSGIECVLFYQPSYGRNSDGSSQIVNTFTAAISSKYLEVLGGKPAYTINTALGSVSMEPSRVAIIVDGKQIFLPPNTFVFQKGDIYAVSDRQQEGTMSSPAPGIRRHAVVQIQGRELLITGKIFPVSDDLVIV